MKNDLTNEEALRMELAYCIRNMYQEKVADKIANSIFNEVMAKRESKLELEDFRKIVEEAVPSSNKKELVVKILIEKLDMYAKGELTSGNSLKDYIEDEAQESSEDEVEDMELKSEGKCTYCKKSFAGNAISKHLGACAERIKSNSKARGGMRKFS